MGIDLTAKLVETATKVAVTRNEYGDINYGSTTSSACLYRDISILSEGANKEQINIDGILWFGASENVNKGDIYYHADEGYLRIVKITKAKRLVADNSRQFIRCEVVKHRQIS
jgi:hypothetical protein